MNNRCDADHFVLQILIIRRRRCGWRWFGDVIGDVFVVVVSAVGSGGAGCVGWRWCLLRRSGVGRRIGGFLALFEQLVRQSLANRPEIACGAGRLHKLFGALQFSALLLELGARFAKLELRFLHVLAALRNAALKRLETRLYFGAPRCAFDVARVGARAFRLVAAVAAVANEIVDKRST
jgi:hypothetical protein